MIFDIVFIVQKYFGDDFSCEICDEILTNCYNGERDLTRRIQKWIIGVFSD